MEIMNANGYQPKQDSIHHTTLKIYPIVAIEYPIESLYDNTKRYAVNVTCKGVPLAGSPFTADIKDIGGVTDKFHADHEVT
jgi:hypothetical protein